MSPHPARPAFQRLRRRLVPAPGSMTGALHDLGWRLRDVFRRRRLEAELAEELRGHLELEEASNRAAGLSAGEAGRIARQQFGPMERLKEECRDEWGFVWLEQLMQDAGFACRALAKAPAFVLGVAGSLAVATGVTAALVDVALQVLHPTLPYPDAATLLVVGTHDTRTNAPALTTAAQFGRFQGRSTSFSRLAAQHPEKMNLVVAGRPAAINAAWITPDFFRAYGVTSGLGRTFVPNEYSAAEHGSVAVLAYGAWVAVFGRDPDVLGRTVSLGGRPRRVVGVMPESFRSPPGFPAWDVFLPATAQALERDEWWQTLVWVVGRLKPGVTPAQAQAELAAAPIPAGLPAEITQGVVPQILPVRDLYRSDRDKVIAILLAAGVLLYATACIGVFNLVLLRTVSRRIELGMRAALGGCRRRIAQLLVVENLLLVAAGGAAAGVFSWWFSSLLVHALHYWWPSAGPISVHAGRLGLFVGIGTLGAIVVVGIVPAICAMHGAGPEAAPQRTGALIDRRPLRRWRAFSTMVQAALAVIMLVGAALCGRALVRLLQSGVGFDPVHRIVVTVQPPPPAMTYPPPLDAYLLRAERLRAELARLPGVGHSVLSSRDPLAHGNELGAVRIGGASAPADILCSFNRVSPDYFTTLGLPLQRGRGFAGVARGDPGVVIINETMARKYFPDENPLGRRLDLGSGAQWHPGESGRAATRERWEIVGVARDVRDEGQRRAPQPQCYVPFWQRQPYDVYSFAVLLQLPGPPPAGFAAAVRRIAFTVDPDLVVAEVASLEERADDSIHLERCASVTLGVVAVIALGLAGLGVFSVLGCVVAEQRREFGVRLALGATPGGVQWFVLRRGLGWTAWGTVLGLGVAWMLARILSLLLYATDPHDPAVFGGVAAVVLVLVGIACWLPARRAAKIDPMIALRSD